MGITLNKINLSIVTICISIFIHLNAQNKITDNIAEIENELFMGNTYEAISLLENIANKKSVNTQELTKINNLLSKANNIVANFDLALLYAKEALQLAKKNNNRLEEAYALDYIGNVYSNTGRFKEAKIKYSEALKIREVHLEKEHYGLALSHKRLGDIYERMGEYDKSLEFLKKALNYNLEDTKTKIVLKADIYAHIAYNFYSKGDYEKALFNFEKSYDYAKLAYKKETPYFISTYNNLGLIYSAKEQYNKSLNYYKKGLSVSVNHYGMDEHPSQARLHFNIGTVYTYQNNKEKGLYHTKKSLNMAIKFFGENHRNLYYPYSQIGELYGNEKGLPYLHKAMEICKNMEGGGEIRISYLHDYFCKIYLNIKDYENALSSSLSSLKTRLNLFGKENVNTIKSYNYVVSSYLALNDYHNAEIYNSKAINANSLSKLENNTIIDSIQMLNYRDLDLLLISIEQKGDIYLQSYLINKKDVKQLITSNKSFKKAGQLLEILRNKQRNHQDKIDFSAITKSIHAKIIQSNLLLNKLFNKSYYLEESFYTSEKNKASVLRELSKRIDLKESLNIDVKILKQETEINNKISELTSKIIKEKLTRQLDSSLIYDLESKLFDLTTQKDSLEKYIEDNYSKYYNLKYSKPIAEIKSIQNQIDANTTIIEYFKSENNIYTYIITKNDFIVKSINVPNLDNQIDALNKHIVNGKKDYLKVSYSLYNQLILPIIKHIKGNNLIIIPDEELWHLQFDLLTTKKVDKLTKHTPYLLLDYSISYANSVSVLFDNNTPAIDGLLNECLAFSYTNNESNVKELNQISLQRFRDSKVDLPGTRKEIKELSKHFNGEYYYGKRANELNFKQNAHKYKLIHLAMHADIDSINSKNLKIIFASNIEDKNEDDYLYGHELYNLNIPAELVVLSACNTGTGKINKGEGILSIGNAFQYGGAKSLLLSRWKISDETTPELMKHFYTNIKNGMTKSKALQQAKISYIKTSNNYISPYYWGSFYILGDNAALNIENKLNYTSIASVIGVLIILILLIIYKN